MSTIFAAGCSKTGGSSDSAPRAANGTQATPPSTTAPVVLSPDALFQDVAAASGLSFRHDMGGKRRFYFIESTPPGCAFLDYDNDGFLDVFLVQSGSAAPSGSAPGVKSRPHCALFHNNRDGTFSPATAGSGLDKDLGYGQGVAVADYDNDGYDDLFVTAYGANHLFRNLGGSGKFEDVTKAMGLDKVHGTGYATSAAFGDYDNDGRLDLYVCYYALWTHAKDKKCGANGIFDYCSPLLYDPEVHQLFRNTGGRFEDVSARAGITKTKGRGLAVAFTDYNEDGRQDIFVANDLTPNMLWRNNGNGTFSDVAVEAGCAYGEAGKAMAGMGIAVADYDRSGRDSLYVSNFSGRPNILFKNAGGIFQDASENANLSLSHLPFLTFGCEFLDYNADGWNDLITNNGHVEFHQAQREAGIPYEQRKQLLRNEGRGVFREITDTKQLGDLATPVVGRGLATGDFDNDGRVDVLCSNQDAPVQLFRNHVQNSNHWVSFKMVGTKSNHNGLHARLILKAGGARQVATVRAGSSYLSSSDRRVYFGLGAAKQIDEVVVRWPGGARDTRKKLAPDMVYTVPEGRGVTGRQRPAAGTATSH